MMKYLIFDIIGAFWSVLQMYQSLEPSPKLVFLIGLCSKIEVFK